MQKTGRKIKSGRPGHRSARLFPTTVNRAVDLSHFCSYDAGMHDVSMTLIIAVVTLLLAAAGAAIGFRRIRFPYTIGLVLIGILIGVLAGHFKMLGPFQRIHLTPNIILYVLLPTLVFDAAVNIDSRLLMKCMTPVLTLAAPGLVIATGITGAIVWLLTPLDIGSAMLFGALISATDPVAVIALFKEIGAPRRLTMLVDGESLFNDATAIVAFQIVLGLIASGVWGASILVKAGLDFGAVFLGGFLVGAVIGYAMILVISLAKNDPLIEIAFSTVVAYASFIFANYFLNVSGVMAVVGAGMVVNWFSSTKFTPAVQQYLRQFWAYASFVANSFIFLLLGLTERDIFGDIGEYGHLVLYVLAAVLAIQIARAVVVFGLTRLINMHPNAKRIDLRNQLVLFWGGLRGALPIGLAVSLAHDFPGRTLIIQLTLGVVLFTLLVQGTTISRLIHWLGLDKETPAERFALAQAQVAAKKMGLREIGSLSRVWQFSESAAGSVKADYEGQLKQVEAALSTLEATPALDPGAEEEILWTQALAIVSRTYTELFAGGFLSSALMREMTHSLEVLRDRVQEGRIPLRLIPAIPLGTRLKRLLLHSLLPVLPDNRMIRRHRARILLIEHQRDIALAQAGRDVEESIDRIAELSSAGSETLARCRTFFLTQREEAVFRIGAIIRRFPDFMGHVFEETIRKAALSGEQQTIDELAGNGAISSKVASQLGAEIDKQIEKINRLEWSEVVPLPERPGDSKRT